MKILKIVNILALVLLVAGCDLFQEPQLNLGENTALVKVDLGGNARTILPNVNTYELKYFLSVAAGDGNNMSPPNPVEIDQWEGGEVELSFGNWLITVTAYTEDGDIAVASGTVPLTVNSMYHEITVPINLPAPGGRGTVEYSVSYPSGGSAGIKLVKWPLEQGGDAVIDEAAVTDGDTVTVNDVESGIYFLTVFAEYEDRSITKNQIVHVYDQCITTINYNFAPADFASSLIKLSGTFNITADGEPVQGIYMEAKVEFYNNTPTIYFEVDITGNNWEVKIPPFAEGTGSINIRFYNSNWIEFNKVHDIGSVTSDVSNSNIVINATTTTLSGYAEIDVLNTEWAQVIIARRYTNEAIAFADIDKETFFWQATFASFEEPTDIYFEVERYDNYWGENRYNLYYYSDDDPVFAVNESDTEIQNINLSYGRILLRGTMKSLTIDGNIPINDPEPDPENYYGLSVYLYRGDDFVDSVYLSEVPMDWAVWISDVYLNETLDFSVETYSNYGFHYANNILSIKIESMVTTGIELEAEAVP